MLGTKDRRQQTIFLTCQLSDLVPDDHILKRVDRLVSFAWVRALVRDTYSPDRGRPSIDPETALRLMLAGYFSGIVSDRKLMREAQVNLAIRWFAGYALDEELPNHSSLTRIRQRWGAQRFREIFEKLVRMCVDAGLVSAETVHFDATLIRANVSWDSVVQETIDTHVRRSVTENTSPSETGDSSDREPPNKPTPSKRRICRTDPDASIAKTQRRKPGEPSYKQHTAVDSDCGVVVDVEVETGTAHEGSQLIEQIERVEEATGKAVQSATADRSYSSASNYLRLEEKGVEAFIPPERISRPKGRLAREAFKYDAHHDVVRCPRKKLLHPKHDDGQGRKYRARTSDCLACPLRLQCVAPSQRAREIRIKTGHAALLRARRRHRRKDMEARRKHRLHRFRVEGVHGEAKTQHGLARAVRRGLEQVRIQAYLTAMAINLKRMVRHLGTRSQNRARSASQILRTVLRRYCFVAFARLRWQRPPTMSRPKYSIALAT